MTAVSEQSVDTTSPQALDTGRPEDVGPGTYVLGIRHHGPGSARGVLAELRRIDPDIVLIEGPADADPLVGFVGSDEMSPPVAILAYAVTKPAVAAFWPFAAFSPEWQAMRWAVDNARPVRFCDLPASMVLAHSGGGGSSGAEPADDDLTLTWPNRVVSTRVPPYGPIPSECSPTRPGTTIPNDGGMTSSKHARMVEVSMPLPRR